MAERSHPIKMTHDARINVHSGTGRGAARSLDIENNAMYWSTVVASVLDETPMTSPKEKAVEFRRQAALYREVAERVSLKEDRERLLENVERLLELARRAEAEADQGSSN